MIGVGSPAPHFYLGAAAAAIVAASALRVGVLSRGGAVAAAGVGAAAAAAGWSWAVLLALYFVSSVALTRFRASVKAARTGAVVAKGGPRDALQVLANGGVFALASLLWLVFGWEGWRAIAAGSLGAAASDTWATEVGTLAGRSPRSVVTWGEVPPGTSGAVSLPGVGAAVAGAAFVAVVALALGWPRGAAAAAAVGGIAGSTADTFLGATAQVRRWCDRCDVATERPAHACGTTTRVMGGIRWLDNDAVNALATAAGGLMGLLVGT